MCLPLQSLSITNSASCTVLKQKKVDLIDQPYPLHLAYPMVASISLELVAKYFIPNPNNLPQVNHKDENKSNNCITNLEWCSNNYNTNYGNRNYNLSRSLKNNIKTSKIVLQYDKDKNLIREWPSINEIRRSLNYCTSSIWRCCQGKQKQAYNYIWKNKEC